MLAHSRTTTEQRSDMDALELGNNSGSLLAAGNRRLSPQARGGFLSWIHHLGWINTDWMERGVPRPDGLVRLPHWQQGLHWILWSRTQLELMIAATDELTRNRLSSLYSKVAH